MPKIKTKSAAKKRFRVRAGGKFVRGSANHRHNTGSKAAKRKRRFRKRYEVTAADTGLVKRMLPNS